MDFVEEVFRSCWGEVVQMYKSDWIMALKSNKDALSIYPQNFYSEADLESILVCKLRNDYESKNGTSTKIRVRNQFTFSEITFRDEPAISEKILNLKLSMKRQDLGKTFKPDIVVDSDDDNGFFRIFSELKYWPSLNVKLVNKLTEKLKTNIDYLKKQCECLRLAKKKELCALPYVCVISDSWESGEGYEMNLLEELVKDFKGDIKFLIAGMSREEKLMTIEDK